MEDISPDPTISQQRLERAPCANFKEVDGLRLNCDNEAKLVCSQCFLVKYCERECQKAHWPLHKVECKSDLREIDWQPTWWREKRKPTFDVLGEGTSIDDSGDLRYLWSSYPSFDILKLAKNEGAGYEKDLALCFAASGDLCNLVDSVSSLPGSYKESCTCVLNDQDNVLVCRNIILLLIAMLLPPVVASEVMLHIWYSARLKPHMLQAIRTHVTPLVADVVMKIMRRSKRVILSKTWTFGSKVVSARLYKDQWYSLLAMVSEDRELAETEESRRYIMLNESRLDTRERHLCSLPPLRRLCASRIRRTGVLLPFGSCLEEYRVPNPTFFQYRSTLWLQEDSSDPIDSWPIKAVTGFGAKYGVPQEDLYGHLHFYVRDKLEAFCNKISSMSIHLHLYCMEATTLPSFIDTHLKFDRIDVSDLADQPHLGLSQTLQTFSPLLKSRKANHHATLLTLFADAIATAECGLGLDYITKTSNLVFRKANQFVDFPVPAFQPQHPQYIRVMKAKDTFRDFDRLFAHYMMMVGFGTVAKEAGVEMKSKNTVVKAWPFRLTKKQGEKGAKEAFEFLEASKAVGSERFVEWVRAE